MAHTNHAHAHYTHVHVHVSKAGYWLWGSATLCEARASHLHEHAALVDRDVVVVAEG